MFSKLTLARMGTTDCADYQRRAASQPKEGAYTFDPLVDIIEAENAAAQVEEESDEEEGVTRCVCGKADSFGLMICCEGTSFHCFSLHLLTTFQIVVSGNTQNAWDWLISVGYHASTSTTANYAGPMAILTTSKIQPIRHQRLTRFSPLGWWKKTNLEKIRRIKHPQSDETLWHLEKQRNGRPPESRCFLAIYPSTGRRGGTFRVKVAFFQVDLLFLPFAESLVSESNKDDESSFFQTPQGDENERKRKRSFDEQDLPGSLSVNTKKERLDNSTPSQPSRISDVNGLPVLSNEDTLVNEPERVSNDSHETPSDPTPSSSRKTSSRRSHREKSIEVPPTRESSVIEETNGSIPPESSTEDAPEQPVERTVERKPRGRGGRSWRGGGRWKRVQSITHQDSNSESKPYDPNAPLEPCQPHVHPEDITIPEMQERVRLIENYIARMKGSIGPESACHSLLEEMGKKIIAFRDLFATEDDNVNR